MPIKRKPQLIPIVVFIAILALLAIVLLNEQYWYIWASFTIAGCIIIAARYNKSNTHKTLTALVAFNIALDSFAIAIWSVFPSTQWSIYQLGFTIVGTEAAVAAAVFAFTLWGLIKMKNWAPLLAIAQTITQRVFATYVFFPSKALLVTLIWSILIIYFAYTDIKNQTNNCA